jgi:hypothetical protein
VAPFQGFIGETYGGRSSAADAERCINLFPEKIESPTGRTKTAYTLLEKPGLASFATLSAQDLSLAGKTASSATLSVVTAQTVPGGASASAVFTMNLPLGSTPPLAMSQWGMFDSSTYTERTNTSTWLGPGGGSQWSYATDNGWVHTSYVNPWDSVVSLFIFSSLSGSGTQQLFVYDCYIDVDFTDGSSARLRPTETQVVTAASGQVLNPANAIDGDLTNYAEIDRSSYGLSDPAILQLYGFEVAYVDGVPQVTNWPTLTVDRVTAEVELNGRGFSMASVGPNSAFFEIHANGTATQYGFGLPGDLRPQMEPSQTQILILAGGQGFVFDLRSNVLSAITAPGFPAGAVKAGYLDGYFIVLEPASQKFAISGLNDGMSWSALDFGDVEGEPGNIVTFVVDHREIWFLGNNHGEIYYNSGDANFPIVRLEGAFMEQGCSAIDAAFQCDNTIFWKGGNRDGQNIFWRANGYTPQRISTYAIEALVDGFGDTSDCRGYCYQEDGHTFARWDFPSANNGLGASLLYDVGEQLWHERGWWDTGLGAYRADLARTHMFVFGKHLVGDYRSGTIYEQSMDYATDAGHIIRCLRAAPDLANGGKWTFYGEFRLLAETGVGLDGGAVPGSDPQAILQLSNDGGKTWGIERSRSMGKIGQYRTTMRWTPNGRSNNRAFRVIIAEPVRVVLIAADLDAV